VFDGTNKPLIGPNYAWIFRNAPPYTNSYIINQSNLDIIFKNVLIVLKLDVSLYPQDFYGVIILQQYLTDMSAKISFYMNKWFPRFITDNSKYLKNSLHKTEFLLIILNRYLINPPGELIPYTTQTYDCTNSILYGLDRVSERIWLLYLNQIYFFSF
jgi:hypothetical protein